MPTAAHPNPYSHLLDEGYFGHRNSSSPVTDALHHSIPRKAVGSPSGRSYSTGSILNSGMIATPSHYSPSSFQPGLPLPPLSNFKNEIPQRKPVQHPPQQQSSQPEQSSNLRQESPKRKPVSQSHPYPQPSQQLPLSSSKNESPNRKAVFQHDHRPPTQPSQPPPLFSSRKKSPKCKPVSQQPPSNTKNVSPEFKASFHRGSTKITSPTSIDLPRPPPPQRHSFLDKLSLVPIPGTRSIREAIATSYQSASTRQYIPRHPLAQNQTAGSPNNRVTALNDFPRISLKDPATARMPSNSPPNPHVVWAPPTLREIEPVDHISPTIIHTTTTIGHDHLRHPATQVDRSAEVEDQNQASSMSHQSTHVPIRESSQLPQTQNDMHNRTSQTPLADIVTLSEHQLTPMKNRTARLCQMTLPEGEEERMKSIPTSTSTYPQTPIKGAYHAALQAFQNSRHKAAMRKTQGQNGEVLTPPKTRARYPQNQMDREVMVVPGGLGGIGDRSADRQHNGENRPNAYQKNFLTPTNASLTRGRRQDGLVVWHQSPSVERKTAGSGYHLQGHRSRGLSPVRVNHPESQMGHRQLRGEMVGDVYGPQGGQQGSRHPKNKAPKPLTPETAIQQTMIRICQTAWWFVEPVFDPHSAIRQRWEQRRLTWKDISLVFAAATFTAGTLMVALVLARIAGLTFQAMKGFMGLLWVVIGV
jgi:hypothetical protein